MSLSGGDVLNLIERTQTDTRNEVATVNTRLARFTAELETLRQRELGVLSVLARIRMREIEGGELKAALDETGRRVRELLGQREGALAAVARSSPRRSGSKRRSSSSARRSTASSTRPRTPSTRRRPRRNKRSAPIPTTARSSTPPRRPTASPIRRMRKPQPRARTASARANRTRPIRCSPICGAAASARRRTRTAVFRARSTAGSRASPITSRTGATTGC